MSTASVAATVSALANMPGSAASFSYKLYNCEACTFHTNNKKDFEKHLQTNKHVKKTHEMDLAMAAPPQTSEYGMAASANSSHPAPGIVQKLSPDPDPDSDSYSDAPPTFTYLKPTSTVVNLRKTTRVNPRASSNYRQALTHHQPALDAEEDGNESFLCLCGKRYKNAHGLRYHKRRCNIITPELVMNIVNDNQELRNVILAQNKLMMEHTQVFQQQISDLIPKLNATTNQMVTSTTTTNNTTIHNHNNTQNTFNLNIFLNEKCKDAWNMSDFIDSLKVTIDDLMVTRERGLGESIGRILVQGLSTLDVYKRPIHCTDLKRDTMYVKDKEVWERDEQHMKIKHAIDRLTYKQIITVDDWKHSQPDMMHNDDLQMEYNTILLKVLTDPREKDSRKIIKNISKETALDKDSRTLNYA
jgi:hypothetical protein